MKKLVCHCIHLALIEFQNAARIRIFKETLKLLNNEDHHRISKIITGDKMHRPFFDTPIRQERKVRIFKGDSKPTIVKKQQKMKKKNNACSFL